VSGGFDVLGQDQLKILGAKLKVADKRLRLDMGKEIRKVTAPLVEELHKSAADTLPRSGGLAGVMASTPIRTSITNGRNGVGVRLRAAGRPPARSVASMDAGRLRHPVFGNRSTWVNQSVKPGWWSKPLESTALKAEVQAGIEHALDETARRLT